MQDQRIERPTQLCKANTAHQQAKIDVIAETAEAALVATANLSAIEPHIADIGALSLAEVVLKAKREVS